MLKFLLVVAAVATLAPAFVSSLANAADPKSGEKAFVSICSACHDTAPGKNKVGPSLAGVVGRKAGTAEGFKLYKGLKDADWTWDEARINEYLKDPSAYTKAHNKGKSSAMIVKIADAKQREDLIAFLKTLPAK